MIPETGEVINLAHKYEYHPDVAPYLPLPVPAPEQPHFSLKRSLTA
jgi:hypothetical protein